MFIPGKCLTLGSPSPWPLAVDLRFPARPLLFRCRLTVPGLWAARLPTHLAQSATGTGQSQPCGEFSGVYATWRPMAFMALQLKPGRGRCDHAAPAFVRLASKLDLPSLPEYVGEPPRGKIGIDEDANTRCGQDLQKGWKAPKTAAK